MIMAHSKFNFSGSPAQFILDSGDNICYLTVDCPKTSFASKQAIGVLYVGVLNTELSPLGLSSNRYLNIALEFVKWNVDLPNSIHVQSWEKSARGF
jgi:hypothetical protein